MDIVSHGLWGGVAFGRRNKKRFWLAFLCGILPDLLSFGVFTLSILLGYGRRPSFGVGPPENFSVPQYVHILYDITHSFIPFAIIFFLLFLIFKRPIWEFSAWGLHILMDIGTHSTEFFPTPFLWPFVDYRFDGIPWSHPIIMIPNILLLIILYFYFFIYKKRKVL
jgi:hypothetical protein